MKKSCLACQKPIKGRTDKKFCDDACRNVYHNRNRKKQTLQIRAINSKLNKNRDILFECSSRGNFLRKIRQEQLIQKGFDFEYFTHIQRADDQNPYFCCYDMAYRINHEGWVEIVNGNSPIQTQTFNKLTLGKNLVAEFHVKPQW